MKKALAIFCSDLHIFDKAPICRRLEDWMGKQFKYLTFLKESQVKYNCPIIIAGDIFHKWFGFSNSYREYMNTFSELFHSFELPIYSIPGNHDLPNHRIELINKSAYKSITTGIIKDFTNKWISLENDVIVYGFPFNSDFDYVPYESEAKEKIAVIHKLIYMKELYPGVDVSGNIPNICSKLPNFNVIVAGDNHDGFSTTYSQNGLNQLILNCGSMMRTNTIQKEYKPRFYVYYGNNEFETVYYPIEKDIFSDGHITEKEYKENRLDIFSGLLDIQKKRTSEIIPFEEHIEEYKKTVCEETRIIIDETLLEAENE